MRRLIPLLIVASAHAADVPQGSEFDPRIQYVNYERGNVVELFASVGADTWVIVGEGENIIKASTGKGDGWLLTHEGRILTVMPRSVNGIKPSSDWNTSLNMMTDNGNLYTMELRYLDGSDELDRAAFRVEYYYPNEAEKARIQAADAEQEKADRCSQGMKNGETVRPMVLDYRFVPSEGSEDIMPIAVFDDGKFTYFRFPPHAKMPAFYLKGSDPEAEPTLANTHHGTWMDDGNQIQVSQDGCGPNDTAVVQAVSSVIVLRSGNQVINVINPRSIP